MVGVSVQPLKENENENEKGDEKGKWKRKKTETEKEAGKVTDLVQQFATRPWPQRGARRTRCLLLLLPLQSPAVL